MKHTQNKYPFKKSYIFLFLQSSFEILTLKLFETFNPVAIVPKEIAAFDFDVLQFYFVKI